MPHVACFKRNVPCRLQSSDRTTGECVGEVVVRCTTLESDEIADDSFFRVIETVVRDDAGSNQRYERYDTNKFLARVNVDIACQTHKKKGGDRQCNPTTATDGHKTCDVSFINLL